MGRKGKEKEKEMTRKKDFPVVKKKVQTKLYKNMKANKKIIEFNKVKAH